MDNYYPDLGSQKPFPVKCEPPFFLERWLVVSPGFQGQFCFNVCLPPTPHPRILPHCGPLWHYISFSKLLLYGLANTFWVHLTVSGILTHRFRHHTDSSCPCRGTPDSPERNADASLVGRFSCWRGGFVYIYHYRFLSFLQDLVVRQISWTNGQIKQQLVHQSPTITSSAYQLSPALWKQRRITVHSDQRNAAKPMK